MKSNVINEWRPQNFNDFVGKTKLKNNLQTYIKSSKIRNQPLSHILFYGVPGTGKTSLANIIANELETNIHIIQGQMLTKTIDVINLLSLIKENDVIFIDEIHACHPSVFETLYSIMEDFAIDVAIGKDFNSKMTRLKVPKFTLIAATTLLGKIPKPLEDRFGFLFFIGEYNLDEIKNIVVRNIKKQNFVLDENEIDLISSVSKGIPRIANRVLKAVIDFKTINENQKIETILNNLSIYDDGLEECDINYLKALFNQENEVGLKSISQILNIDQLTIETKIEPFLIKNNYILKTLKGRKLSAKGIEYIKKILK